MGCKVFELTHESNCSIAVQFIARTRHSAATRVVVVPVITFAESS